MLALCGGLAASVMIAEAALYSIENTPLWRVLPVVERELGLPDATLGYRFQADHAIINVRENRARVASNAQAMRDRQRTVKKPPGVQRAAFMGDSFTEALQVPVAATFVSRTEQMLNTEAASGKYETLNFGMSGFGPLQQLLRYQADAQDFAPDATVFMIGMNDFINNELSDDASGPAYVNTNNGELEIGRAYRQLITHRLQDTLPGKLFFWAMDHSRIARAVFLQYRVGKHSARPHRTGNALGCEGFARKLASHEQLWLYQKPQPKAQRLARFLDDVKNAAIKAPVFALYDLPVPEPACTDAANTRSVLVKAIRNRLANNDIRLLDMDDALFQLHPATYRVNGFRGFGSRTGAGHLNFSGHEVFAEVLSRKLFSVNPEGQKP